MIAEGESGNTAAGNVTVTPTGSTPTPPTYTTGWVKQDPNTLAVAVRTNIPDPLSDHDWGVMTVDRGGHYANWDAVSGWTDLTP
jgi:hypothetical protein